jgi:voltage-gated potassium channel Kch
VSVVIFAFVITALATPLLFSFSDRIYSRLRPLLGVVGIRSRGTQADPDEGERPARLVLLGFHRVTSALLADLARLHPDLVPATLVIDTNMAAHEEIRRRGARVIYGDVASPEVLRHANIGAAEVVLSTVPDELLKGTTNEQLVRTIRAIAPAAVVIANCTRVSQVAGLRQAGAHHVFRMSTEVALGVLPAIYAALNAALPSYLEALEQQHGRLEDRAELLD